MEKKQLHNIFSKSFNSNDWLEVLQNVFGAKQLLAQPREILLPSNDKAKAAYELGNFTTTDDRIIGLYRIELNPDVWLERNKVGLRELLRNIYKYDVDGAIIVFDQGKKWRLSFVSEIKVLNDEGEVIEQATEPKRYTYLLGQDEKVKTPSERLNNLAGKPLALNDILEAFSVEALNEEFYKIVAEYFYQLIGGKIGKGKKGKDYGAGILQLPSVPKENHQVYQEFTVRLIGRTVFCWFLKMKKGDNEESLLPEKLLSSKAVKDNSGYYHSVLERLFFQTLNTRMSERVDNLPDGCEQIPFLNGGLFEPGKDDYYRANRITGLSENLNTLKIEDHWFLNFFQELEKYNFTIDENSVTDVEVSVDPEMLGRIFENLLAEIDPDSGETARKATGSFYTPREIVDYMATESLVQYLHNKTDLKPEILRPVFKMTEQEQPKFSDTELENILDALDKVKILDPACGSGAFPMGVLQKIVMVLQKLDPEAEWWKKRQLKRITNPIVKKALREKLDASSVEYARKIGIIQNSLYGVDIQPIAAEISKLRCFLTLIVDENIDDTKENRGIEPLPNLEFKFVTADTLMKLPVERDFGGLFNSNDDVDKLKELREEYLQSSGKKKEKIKARFIKVQTKMFKNEMHLFADTQSRAYKLSSWNPFSHDKADWFDPKWMYGVDNFDVVIGNPPYVEFKNLDKEIKNRLKHYKTLKGKYDLYIAFLERPYDFLSQNGILTYICPTRFMHRDYGQEIRKYLPEKYTINQIIDFGDSQVFSSATTYTGVFVFEKKESESYNFICCDNINKRGELLLSSKKLTPSPWYFQDATTENILKLIRKNTKSLDSIVEGIYQGVATGKDSVFVIGEDEIKEFRIENTFIKPFLMGKNISTYKINWANHYVVYPYDDDGQVISENRLETESPNIYEYLLKNRSSLSGRGYFDKSSKKWFELWNQRNYKRFSVPKIITLDNASRNSFALDRNGFMGTTTTYSIIPKKGLNINYLLGLLNSNLLEFYHKKNTIPQANGFYRYQKTFIKSFPIKVTEKQKQTAIINIVDAILFINSDEITSQINPHVPNSHLVQLFEEVIDAMVMELYFKEDFRKAGISFINYAERDFKAIEHLKTEKEKIEVIHQAYQKLREKDNEIRNNLKLMDIKLADIVMPIKTAK